MAIKTLPELDRSGVKNADLQSKIRPAVCFHKVLLEHRRVHLLQIV